MAATDAVRTTDPTRRAQPALDADPAALRAVLDARTPPSATRSAPRWPQHTDLLDEQRDLPGAELRRRCATSSSRSASAARPPTASRSVGGGGDIGASIASFETLAYGDLSVVVKSGVQFGLFGGAVLQLGRAPTTSATCPTSSRALLSAASR